MRSRTKQQPSGKPTRRQEHTSARFFVSLAFHLPVRFVNSLTFTRCIANSFVRLSLFLSLLLTLSLFQLCCGGKRREQGQQATCVKNFTVTQEINRATSALEHVSGTREPTNQPHQPPSHPTAPDITRSATQPATKRNQAPLTGHVSSPSLGLVCSVANSLGDDRVRPTQHGNNCCVQERVSA